MHRIVMVQGLQYGSEAKGSIVAGVAKHWKPDTTVTAWGPNAGHTVRDGEFKFVSSMLATAALYPTVRTILIGPGSVVDFNKLTTEVREAGRLLQDKTLIIHARASYLRPEHAEIEKKLLRIGSTMKGTMQATIDKMNRQHISVVAGARDGVWGELFSQAARVNLRVVIADDLYDAAIDNSERMVVEGAQGFSLGIHEEFYPYCTSRDVSTAQVMADCRIPYPALNEEIAIIGVIRTYPIRVASRTGEFGQQYTSGGIYEDQVELDWKRDLGREPELTTVTKLPRRVFSFSFDQIRKAVRIVKPTQLALSFCDYLEDKPTLNGDGNGLIGDRVRSLVRAIHEATDRTGHQVRVETVSYGPDQDDIFDLSPDFTLRHEHFTGDDDGRQDN